MPSINSDKLSNTDLHLLIESIEKIAAMDRVKHKSNNHNLIETTFKYLDHHFSARSSPTLFSAEEPADESLLENIEEKRIPYHSVAKDMIYNVVYKDKQLGCDITCAEENIYDNIDESYIDDLYNLPMFDLESTTISESLYSMCENVSPTVSITSGSYMASDDSFYSMCDNVSPTVSITSGSFAESVKVDQTKKKSIKKRLLSLVRKHFGKHLMNKS